MSMFIPLHLLFVLSNVVLAVRLGDGDLEKSTPISGRPTSNPTNSSSSSEEEEEDCCGCPLVNISAVENVHAVLREAFDRAVPGKWYPEGGTLIGTLRYGASIKRLNSGKLAWVDEDVDFAILCKESERNSTVARIVKELPSTYKYIGTRKWGSEQFETDFVLPSSCSEGGKKAYDGKETMHVHVAVIYEEENGTVRPDPAQEDKWYPDMKGVANISLPVKDIVIPFRKGKWGGGIVDVPNHYLLKNALGRDEEYGANFKFKELWRPQRLTYSYCECPIDQNDINETKAAVEQLHTDNFASYYGFMYDDHDLRDVKWVKKFQKENGETENSSTYDDDLDG